jgi:outer membrane biosynthesis protein TonB
MRFPVQCVVLMLLPLVMTACQHKQQKAQLPPLAPPETANIPPPSNAPPPPNETIPNQPTQKAPTPPEPAAQPVKKKKKPKPPADTTQQAAAPSPNPEVSAIGQLSSGDPAEVRRQTENSINSIEQGLEKIKGTLNDSEQKTADHIREFIKEAKAALTSGDVDGAHTLTEKAQVLLNELTNK